MSTKLVEDELSAHLLPFVHLRWLGNEVELYSQVSDPSSSFLLINIFVYLI